MTAHISAYGRLVAEVQTRTTDKGTPMAMGRLAVPLPCHSAQDGQATFWVGVVAFGKAAEALSRHDKGDLISVAGAMQINQWTGQDGGTQTGYQVVADSVISAKTVRPKGGKKSTPPQAGQQPTAPNAWDVYRQPEDYDQSPPFDTPFHIALACALVVIYQNSSNGGDWS